MIYKHMLNMYNNNPKISGSEFIKEANNYYKQIDAIFAINNTIWKNMFRDIKKMIQIIPLILY